MYQIGSIPISGMFKYYSRPDASFQLTIGAQNAACADGICKMSLASAASMFVADEMHNEIQTAANAQPKLQLRHNKELQLLHAKNVFITRQTYS